MFVTKKRLLEEVRKAKLEGIAEGKQDVERQVEMAKLRGEKEGYNHGHSDRTTYYTQVVIPPLRNEINTYEVANKSLREIGERLMFRVSELKDEKEELEEYKGNLISVSNMLKNKVKAQKKENEELKLNNDLYDFQEIKRLEQLMKKVKRVKVKKKIQSRIDKLMIRGL